MKRILLLSVTAAVLMSSCGSGNKEKAEDKDTVKHLPQVSVVKTEPTDFQNFVEVQGSVDADKNVTLTAEMGGLIKRILVEEGQWVKTGQTLVILDESVINNNIEEVQKSLELANYVFQKQEALYKQDVGSELQYTQAKNNKERLEQTLQTLQAQKAMLVISAPFDGYVDEIFPHEGEMALPQLPVIRLLDLRKVHVNADVMESYLKTVTKEKSVDVFIRALDTTFKDCKIARVGKYINPSNRTFSIQVDLENSNEQILPNLVAILRIKNEILSNVLVVPNESLMQSSSGANYLFIAEQKEGKTIAKKIDVTPGPSDDQHTVIYDLTGATSRLKSGDKVITVGARGVKQGMEIEIK